MSVIHPGVFERGCFRRGSVSRAAVAAASLIAAWFGGACHKSTKINQTQGTPSSSASSLPLCTGAAPPVGGGPVLVSVGRLDQTCAWIDKTEVTRAQYKAFVDSAQRPAVPGCDAMHDLTTAACEQAAPIPVSKVDTSPITCVDWCDAAIFCAWAGKSLCTGSSTYPSIDDGAADTWYAACANGDANPYPYGTDYEPDSCNVGDTHTTGCIASPTDCTTSAAGTLHGCAAENGALDLVGNASEWTGECQGDKCRVRGGSYADGAGDVTCSTTTSFAKTTSRFDLGFRCCVE